MEDITDIIKKACNEKELLKKNHLKSERKTIAFGKLNIVIGKNGSGKSRMLRFIRDVGEKYGCSSIILDFTEEIPPNDKYGKEIGSSFVFKDPISNDVKTNLFTEAKHQVEDIFTLFGTLVQNRPKEIENIFDTINQELEKLLGRKLLIKDENFYLYNIKTGEEREFKDEKKVLSPGEKNLLAFTLAMLCVKLDPQEQTLVLIDEIEMHLHPAVVLQAFDMLRRFLQDTNSCVFIATHSIFLLQLFKFTEIVYMENGRIAKESGGLYKEIIDALIYGGNDRGSLVDFFASYDEWSYAEYLAECFMPPEPVGTVDPEDVQYLKLKEVIQKLRVQGQPLQILDYGAGQARIGQCMALDRKEMYTECEILYHVYDRYVISEKFREGEGFFGQAFKDEQQLKQKKGSMDIVLLYNVLHEVSIEEWVDELNLALSMLKPRGALIFSERKTLSLGEKPYGKSGYLLLGREETKILFKEMEVEEVFLKETIRDKTIGFAIYNPDKKSITQERVQEVLKELLYRTRETIDKYVKEDNADKLKARDYAFYCQQFFNVENALELLNKSNINAAYRRQKELLYILGDERLSEQEKLIRIKERALIDDEEGNKCREFLKNKI